MDKCRVCDQLYINSETDICCRDCEKKWDDGAKYTDCPISADGIECIGPLSLPDWINLHELRKLTEAAMNTPPPPGVVADDPLANGKCYYNFVQKLVEKTNPEKIKAKDYYAGRKGHKKIQAKPKKQWARFQPPTVGIDPKRNSLK